jgi:hypothetical protein
MSLLPILSATMAICPHLPAEARANFVPERDLYAIYAPVIEGYLENRAVAEVLAPMLGQNVSTDDALCALMPPIDVESDP